jgi:aminomethyltransferase
MDLPGFCQNVFRGIQVADLMPILRFCAVRSILKAPAKSVPFMNRALTSPVNECDTPLVASLRELNFKLKRSIVLGQASSLQQTPLWACHQTLAARMAGFGGWDMPIQYQGITLEHQAVRQQAGMFDISHMGKFQLQGPCVLTALQTLVPSDLSVLKPGQAKYTVLLNATGGIIDDLIIYPQVLDNEDSQRVFIIVNAATTAKDKAWLTEQLTAQSIALTDVSQQNILIAVQGPQAITRLQALATEPLLDIPNYWHREITLMGQPAWVARTGYTGEDGFEVMVPAERGQELWERLLNLGVTPCGLGARDTLRLEAAMALYGQDINETTTPLETGLGWVVNLDKPDFIGREALLEQKAQGLSRSLVGLEMQGRHIARHDYEVQHAGETVGVVTSGTFSPTLEKAIALAHVPPTLAQVGQPLEVIIRGKACPATVVKRPFYRRPRG